MTRKTITPLRVALVLALGASDARAQPRAHLLKGPYLQDLGAQSVEIRAELDVPLPATVTLIAKGEGDAGAPKVAGDAASTMHVLRVEGLSPSTRYAYVLHAGPLTAAGELVTAPPPTSTAPFTFLIYGDNRSDDAAHAAIVRAMLQVPSDFIVNTGDAVEDGSVGPNWQTFFDVEAPLLRDRCVFACVGNHEIVDGAGTNYLRYFGPVVDSHGDAQKPKLFGSFRWGSTRFFLLDSMESRLRSVPFADGPERAWLDDELSRTDAETDVRWRIVVLHQSPWSAGPHGGNHRLVAAGIPALFARHHIDLILGGHDHIYERGFGPPGIPYIVSGGGGAPLYPIDHPIATTRKAESAHHFVTATVSPDAIRILATRDDGSLLDRCNLLKSSGAWDCDPLPPSTTKSAPAPAPPAPTESPWGCSAAGVPLPSSRAWLGTLLMVVARRVRRRNRG